MLKSINYLGVAFLSILLLTNCTKDDKKDDATSPGEMVFAASDGNTEKDGEYDFLCVPGLVVAYAKVVLKDEDGIETTYTPATFELDNILYSQSITLMPGAYKIIEFSLMTADDVVVKSTPIYGADFAQFVTYPLDNPDYTYDFSIVEFQKEEFMIDVLCFIPTNVENFGFEWFEVTPINVLNQCFFGNICIDSLALYGGSLYGPIVEPYEVALFKIVVLRDDVKLGEFFNWHWENINGNDKVVIDSSFCIDYANYNLEENNFQFELWIYVWDEVDYMNPNFIYKKYYTWNLINDAMIPANNGEVDDDGVIDFVLGTCVYGTADLQLPIVD